MLFSSLLLTLCEVAAAEPSAPPTPPPSTFRINGEYSLWNLQQRNFLLGAAHPLDDTAYTVQNLRVNVAAGRENYGVVARFDAAQGWWGVDNDPATGYTAVTDDEGNTTVTRVYNDDGLFRNKDTHYAVHFDLAYGRAAFGPVELRGGRQAFSVGRKLVLDEEYDGITALIAPEATVRGELFWAKVAEGKYAGTLPGPTLMSDDAEAVPGSADADLYGGKLRYVGTGLQAELFGLWFHDATADDWAWLPQGLGYNRARFTPQATSLGAAGISAEGKLRDVFAWRAEADVLFGADRIDNADHAGGAIDVNDGSLFGWNLLADGTYALPIKPKADVGALVGVGSGDPDPRDGGGNVNRISTMGGWSMTNVWEDSVMPDIAGISPQGLGSPVSRGYRELENTTALQGRLGVHPAPPLRLEGAFTYLHATQPVYGFDAAGAPTGSTAQDLGWEVDANAILTLREGQVLGKVLFGWFQPGDAAGLLINGTTDHLDPAAEVKVEAIVRF